MSVENKLNTRADNKCELCSSEDNLQVYNLETDSEPHEDHALLVCDKCKTEFEGDLSDHSHWRCIANSMWSEFKAVQVMAWRVLNRLKAETWASDLIEQLYLDEETLAFAKKGQNEADSVIIKDSNGTQLAAGDSVTLIKDLDVKGANFTAKRGTMVKNISLTDDPKFIEGKINGSQIVIVAAFVKKQ